MTNSLTSLPDPSKVSPMALLNVLQRNAAIGPMFFSIAHGSLVMNYPVPNCDMTAAGVRSNVDALVGTVLDTEPLWNPDALAGNAPAPQPAPVNPLSPPAPVNPLSPPAPVNPLAK